MTSVRRAGALSGEVLFASLALPPPPEAAETQLRRYILERRLQPGDRLPSEAVLATLFGSSRVIIREGLRALELLGVLEARVGSGWYVRRFEVALAARAVAQSLAFHPAALLDLLALRRAAEAELITTLAGRLVPRDLALLDDLVDRMRWQASRNRPFIAEDAEFHRRLFAAGGNQVALVLADLYWNVMERIHGQGFPPPEQDVAQQVADQHGRIVAALRHGDAAGARDALLSSYHQAIRDRIERWLAGQAGAAAGTVDPAQHAIQAALLGRDLPPTPPPDAVSRGAAAPRP